jgi:hypothetical protein
MSGVEVLCAADDAELLEQFALRGGAVAFAEIDGRFQDRFQPATPPFDNVSGSEGLEGVAENRSSGESR